MLQFSVILNSIITTINSLDKVNFLYDSDRSSKIVQMNGLHTIYSRIDIYGIL